MLRPERACPAATVRSETRRARRRRGCLRRAPRDVGVDLQLAAPGIDQVGAAERAVALELAEQRKIEDALGRRRMRQQADQDFGAGQKGVETGRRREILDAGIAFGVRLQPAT